MRVLLVAGVTNNGVLWMDFGKRTRDKVSRIDQLGTLKGGKWVMPR